MKTKKFTKSVPQRSKKKDWTYWLVVGIIACTMIFSVFGMTGFCMQVFAEELPSDYTLQFIQVNENISNQFVKVDGSSADLTVSISGQNYRFLLDSSLDVVQVFPPDFTFDNPTDFEMSLPYFSDGIFYLDSEVFTTAGIQNNGDILYVSGNVLLLVAKFPNQHGLYVSSIISILMAGLVPLALGLGAGLSDLAGSIFLVNGALSPFAIVILIFSALALSVGLSRLIVRWCASLGGRDV